MKAKPLLEIGSIIRVNGEYNPYGLPEGTLLEVVEVDKKRVLDCSYMVELEGIYGYWLSDSWIDHKDYSKGNKLKAEVKEWLK